MRLAVSAVALLSDCYSASPLDIKHTHTRQGVLRKNMRHPRDRANATGDARIVSRVFSNPRAGCSKSNLTFPGVEREPDACFNSLYTSGECCLGKCRAPRGRCIGGVCECHASFAGFDCSDHPADGHPAGFIYVHAPPPKALSLEGEPTLEDMGDYAGVEVLDATERG